MAKKKKNKSRDHNQNNKKNIVIVIVAGVIWSIREENTWEYRKYNKESAVVPQWRVRECVCVFVSFRLYQCNRQQMQKKKNEYGEQKWTKRLTDKYIHTHTHTQSIHSDRF